MTEQQWRILRTLYADGELMIGQIAERCVILSPSLTGILQRMIDADVIVKRVDADDTRRFYVSLTKLGRAKFEAMVPRIEAAYSELEKEVGKEEIERLYAAIDCVLGKLGERGSAQAVLSHGVMP